MPSAPGRFRPPFPGAHAFVTRPRCVVAAGDASALVDCGLFQGYQPVRLRNGGFAHGTAGRRLSPGTANSSSPP